jgi:hypothetical protein
MSFQKIPNGEYYYFFREHNTERMVRANGRKNSRLGKIAIQSSVPAELVGKRIRIKLEIVEEQKRL